MDTSLPLLCTCAPPVSGIVHFFPLACTSGSHHSLCHVSWEDSAERSQLESPAGGWAGMTDHSESFFRPLLSSCLLQLSPDPFLTFTAPQFTPHLLLLVLSLLSYPAHLFSFCAPLPFLFFPCSWFFPNERQPKCECLVELTFSLLSLQCSILLIDTLSNTSCLVLTLDWVV